MAELMQEALNVVAGWGVNDIKNETIVFLVIAFAMMALDSEEDKVPKVLEKLIEALRRFRTKEATILADRVRNELESNWIPPTSHHEHEALML
jgi:cysteinyl-tRNA synthetase